MRRRSICSISNLQLAVCISSLTCIIEDMNSLGRSRSKALDSGQALYTYANVPECPHAGDVEEAVKARVLLEPDCASAFREAIIALCISK